MKMRMTKRMAMRMKIKIINDNDNKIVQILRLSGQSLIFFYGRNSKHLKHKQKASK